MVVYSLPLLPDSPSFRGGLYRTLLAFVDKAEESFRAFKGKLEFEWPKGFLLALVTLRVTALLVRNDRYTRGFEC